MSAVKKNDYHHGNLKETLVQSTLEIMSTTEIDKISMSVLAKHVGVSRTALYAHFADKDALLSEVAAYGFRKLGAQLADVLASDSQTTPKEQSFAIIYIRFALEHKELFRLMFGPRLTNKSESLKHDAEKTFGKVQFIIKERLAEKGITSVKDINYNSISAWASVHGLTTLLLDGLLDPSMMDSSNLEDFTSEILLRSPFAK